MPHVAVVLAAVVTEGVMVAPAWDSANGVFVGNKAATGDSELLSPLWIFGYGSLVWRPEPGWEAFRAARGSVDGWSRWFAQRSMDHRGTPQAPGLVCTLLPDCSLDTLGARGDRDKPSTTLGVAYLIPDDHRDDVLANLDFREKGGYTRAIADVRLEGAEDGASIRALVYSATIDNPNFVPRFVTDDPAALDEAAAIIATTRGPSGPNNEYLYKLADAIPDDPYLKALEARVRERALA
ncbi:hypothetical protein CTAYLR_000237 [Chrysophaeum taylorii]|uniref:glutathione-specific gamma-glutamylcyclotransferase n=1 Tax=Chrysophaeum taylorii TaxID=2483200 RepID=A0AAD7XPK1_9STRA|nr:hypothetical protein CTAYLR_000237 [Chrysophaeum taylorii]